MRALFAVLLLSCGGPPTPADRVTYAGQTWRHVDFEKDVADRPEEVSGAQVTFRGRPDGGGLSTLLVSTNMVLAGSLPEVRMELFANGESMGSNFGTALPGGRWHVGRNVVVAEVAPTRDFRVLDACVSKPTLTLEARWALPDGGAASASVTLDGGQPQRMREVLEAWKYFGGAW